MKNFKFKPTAKVTMQQGHTGMMRFSYAHVGTLLTPLMQLLTILSSSRGQANTQEVQICHRRWGTRLQPNVIKPGTADIEKKRSAVTCIHADLSVIHPHTRAL